MTVLAAIATELCSVLCPQTLYPTAHRQARDVAAACNLLRVHDLFSAGELSSQAAQRSRRCVEHSATA
jgi:hypothetical protein